MSLGTLYLVPSDLGAAMPASIIPEATLSVVHRLRNFIVENPKTARAYLKAVAYPHPLQETAMEVLDEHTPSEAMATLLGRLQAGADVGLMSEAGCPGVADPGAQLVRLAHALGIQVRPLVGPSAILLAVMASGMNGQRFTFHGYLPADASARRKRIAELETLSAREDATQVFIETPYRNETLLAAVLEQCKPDTRLCIAVNLTGETESVHTKTVAEWRRAAPDIKRRPAVFLLYRGAS